MSEHKSGFISIIGRPNVGKSTFMNQILGRKVAIMSDKAQTTRNRIQGILTKDTHQLIFIDTPGIHKPKHALGDYMMSMAKNTLDEVDVIMFMVNVNEKLGKGDEYIINMLKSTKTPVFLVLNKIDLIHPDEMLSIIEQYRQLYDFKEIIPISAINGQNIETLETELVKYMEEGPQFFPPDQVTDHPEQFIMAEMIREKILQTTEQEIPHSVGVVIESLERIDEDNVDVNALIYVERASQKGIIIGKNGAKLKEIGKRARKDIEHLLGSKVYLQTWVKVQADWRNKPNFMRQIGYVEDE